MIPAMKISDSIRDDIKANLVKQLTSNEDRYVFFRRVSGYHFTTNDPEVRKYKTPISYDKISMADYEKLSPDDRKKYVNIIYKDFCMKTSPRYIREENSKISGKVIYLKKYNYAELDVFENYTFDFGKSRGSPCTPMPDDLVFGYISKENYDDWVLKSKTNQRYQLRADKWFVASDQFLRAWTVLVYENHDIIRKIVPNKYRDTDEFESMVRKNLFRSNRLMTNTLLKRKLLNNTSILQDDEFKKIFVYMRTETASKKWVDIWACLVMIVKYGEIPCYTNKMVHYNNDGTCSELQRQSWSIPSDFVRMFFVRFAKDITKDDVQYYEEWCKNANADSSKTFFENINFITKAKIETPDKQ